MTFDENFLPLAPSFNFKFLRPMDFESSLVTVHVNKIVLNKLSNTLGNEISNYKVIWKKVLILIFGEVIVIKLTNKMNIIYKY